VNAWARTGEPGSTTKQYESREHQAETVKFDEVIAANLFIAANLDVSARSYDYATRNK
jgi:hypothetical protein